MFKNDLFKIAILILTFTLTVSYSGFSRQTILVECVTGPKSGTDPVFCEDKNQEICAIIGIKKPNSSQKLAKQHKAEIYIENGFLMIYLSDEAKRVFVDFPIIKTITLDTELCQLLKYKKIEIPPQSPKFDKGVVKLTFKGTPLKK